MERVMPTILDTSGRTWTYGCEHELADWDTRKGWEGFDTTEDYNICNSNGISGDPKMISYPYGREVNTRPSSTPQEQGDMLEKFLKRHPESTANWISGFHVHIRMPGLSESLPMLKRLQRYITDNTDVYPLIDRLPRENRQQHPTDEEFKEARHRYNLTRASHSTAIPESRVRKQEAATSLEEFFAAEVPTDKNGKPLWHAQRRAGINLRQLLQTDTIEFRHWPVTLSPQEVITSVEWCRDWLKAAMDGYRAVDLFNERYSKAKFPTLDTIYCGWQYKRWLRTSILHNKREVVEANIAEILAEDQRKNPAG